MKRLRIISLLAATIIMCTSVSAFASTPGSANDPLISKSYIDGTYSNELMSLPLANLDDSIVVFKYKLNQLSLAEVSTETKNIASGATVSVKACSELTLISGTMKLASSNGLIIDVTSGNKISAGQNIKAAHHYITGENTSTTFSVISDCKVMLCGNTSISSTPDPTPQFSDVPKGEWYYDAVYYSVQKGLINGKTSERFDPSGNTTIAETIKLAACIHQLHNDGEVTLQNGSPWYKTYVDYSIANGIISGEYSDYNARIDRSEFVHIFYGALEPSEYTQINSVADNSIPDISTSSKYSDEIYAFYRCGMLTGVDGLGTFMPDKEIPRREVATIVMRMLEPDERKSITLE